MTKTSIYKINRLSRLFQPVHLTPEKVTKESNNVSKSYKHLINYGYIKPLSTGMFALLPLGLRVLDKLIALVDNEMSNIGAQKLLLPALTESSLWKCTHRFEDNRRELFILQDRHDKQYILSPTHEEAICNLISSIGMLPSKLLPLRLYQISSKWRDEIKPRLGFLRSKEFIMKDLYTFDSSLEDAQKTYESVCEAYDNIFQKIGIKSIKAIGDSGTIGGIMSHEYHYSCDFGEDIICVCPSCQYSINKNVYKESQCPECKTSLSEHGTAEVGHTFLLDTTYSKPLNALCREKHVTFPLSMGCYGLGLSRIFSVSAEILSTTTDLKWPKCLAPYTVCLIPPKAGSKEESASQYINAILEILGQQNIDVILDDRTKLTIGNRFVNARATGFPYIIVIGRSAMNPTPLFEIHNTHDSICNEVTIDKIRDYLNTGNVKS